MGKNSGNPSTHVDMISLGEVMLRLDPGHGRIRTARNFDVWEGGGEYNVARGLSNCFGLRTAIVTALVDNEIGRLVETLIAAGRVNTNYIQWVKSDPAGRGLRNGINFTERGYGVRGALGVSDRGHTAVASFNRDSIDWESLFNESGARWFHTGGIFAALSDNTASIALQAMQTAKRLGLSTSYDLNYRASLWESHGGLKNAQAVNTELVRHADVLIGNEEDYTACLGLAIEGVSDNLTQLPIQSFQTMIGQVATQFPNVQVSATTLRSVKTASINDWSAIAWSRDEGFVQSFHREDLEIFDRVGGGDSFASGLIYGLLNGDNMQTCVEIGAAHGALAMTTPGDTSMATLAEVLDLAEGKGARIQR